MIPEPLPWIASAKWDEVGGDLWFPNEGIHADKARAICHTCPVIDQCYQYAQNLKVQHGVWAGYTPGQLARIRQKERAA